MESDIDHDGVARSIGLLSSTPGRFRSAYERLGESEFSRRPSDETWSPLDVLVHLRASDAILTGRIWSVLVQPDSLFALMDERQYGELIRRSGLPPLVQIDSFTLRRQELVGLLRSLSDNEWAATIWSTPLWQLVTSMPEHEQEHLTQLGMLSAHG
jgi:hypothetical protein